MLKESLKQIMAAIIIGFMVILICGFADADAPKGTSISEFILKSAICMIIMVIAFKIGRLHDVFSNKDEED